MDVTSIIDSLGFGVDSNLSSPARFNTAKTTPGAFEPVATITEDDHSWVDASQHSSDYGYLGWGVALVLLLLSFLRLMQMGTRHFFSNP